MSQNQARKNLACLVRLYSGGQWTISEAKNESLLCIGSNRRCPFPLVILFPGRLYMFLTLFNLTFILKIINKTLRDVRNMLS